METTIEWNGKSYDVPNLAQLEEWEREGGCETPEGEWVEPDHEDSWLFLLGLI